MHEQEIKSTPITDYLESLGGKVELSDGKKIIVNYAPLENELDSLYNGVGVRDISHSGIIELKGADVLDYIHRIGTNATKDLPKEGITKTIFTTEKGKIIDLAMLANFEDYQLLICSDEFKMKLLSWLNRYVINDDVRASIAVNKYTLLEFIGPQSESFISLICGSQINSMKINTFKIFSTEGMIFFLFKIPGDRDSSNQGRDNRIKFRVIADPGNAKQILKYLNENKGPFNYNLIGEDAYKIYRIENGIPEAPFEINDQYNPHDIGLADLIDFNKGCYIGQEVISRLSSYDKVQHVLSGIVIDGTPDINVPLTIWPASSVAGANGSEAGTITSITYSPRLKKNIGLAILRKIFTEENTKLEIKNGNQIINAAAVSLPFIK